jgi:hypothetical protein
MNTNLDLSLDAKILLYQQSIATTNGRTLRLVKLIGPSPLTTG